MSNGTEVYEALAAALAEVREPDLSPFDPAAVRQALEDALATPAARTAFLALLKRRVRSLSGGRVTVEERSDIVAAGDPQVVPEVPVRIIVAGEPFAEPAVLRADDRGLHYPMRG